MSIFSKSCLGIDIGASSVKVVQVGLPVVGEKKKLENYLKFSLPLDSSSIETFHGESLVLLSDEVSEILKGALDKAGIKNRKAAFSLPDFSTFFTTFELPPMEEKEAPQAIEFEARHHIPLPLSKVTFDWQIIKREELPSGVKLKILLVAIPNRVLRNYQRVVNLTEMEVKGMEAEAFALKRAAIPEGEGKTVALVDFGWESTTVSIIKGGSLYQNHSLKSSGNSFSKSLVSALDISFDKAEKLKKKHGLNPKKKKISGVLIKEVNSVISKIKRISREFKRDYDGKVEKIIIAGGGASLFGLKEYLNNQLSCKVEMVDPFTNLSSPSILHPRLKQIGPSFAVAAGVAMMGVEK